MSWKPATPYLSVDGIVEIYDKDENFEGIVIIQRKNEPVGFALPGGFVDVGESVENAVVREMKEEISLDVEIEGLLGVYSDPSRDKRFHTVSVVFICKAYGKPIGEDDAKEALLVSLDSLKLDELVFDHSKIIKDYINIYHPLL
jgi:8-oxo-dGTP diphosphatase